MIDEIAANLFKIELPLPHNLLKSMNCYLIRGSGQFLLIDTGMNRIECLNAIQVALRRLQVNLKKTDFFITHLHADHIGLVSELATGTSKIYFSEKESLLVKRGDFWAHAYPAFRISGFDQNGFDQVKAMFPQDRYGPKADSVFDILSEGNNITIGDYCLTCIETPGHSPAHLCLYDATRKLLFSGDHLLWDVTPNISGLGFFFDGVTNPLKNYLESLDKIYGLDVSLVLPGHRRLFNNHRKRISELKRHHEMRSREILSILQGQEDLTAYEIAARMGWKIYGPWADFPAVQKWFATGEAFAHLLYMENKGEVSKQTKGVNDPASPDVTITRDGKSSPWTFSVTNP